jgi:hypothetical protein
MTYLELVNDVLLRLREQTVTTVNLTTYSQLIGKFVNDSKRQIEDAYDWNALGTEVTVTTSASVYEYALTGAGQKFRVSSDPLNTTSNVVMRNITVGDMRCLPSIALKVSTAAATLKCNYGADLTACTPLSFS